LKLSVSINLCCYNSEKYLRETIDSIVNQIYKDWELVIINDGSTDSTESIIYEYINQDYPIIYHYQENHGLGYSRNEALKRSQGEYIAFIDHDDIWLPEKLERQIPLFDDPEVGLVFSDAIYFRENGKDERLYEKEPYWEGNCFSQLISNYFLCLPTVVIRRSCLDDLDEWFDLRFKMIEEADLFRRISYKWKLRIICEPLSRYRIHESSFMSTHGYLEADETFLMLLKFENIFKDFKNRYYNEITILERVMILSKAKYLIIDNNDYCNARKCLYPHMLRSLKALLFIILSFYPRLLRKLIMRRI
jgi:glycosyltransferase involved in cell wall biosynthesis